jgi:hypothetical protein
MRVFCDNYDCKFISRRKSKKPYNHHHFVYQCNKPGDLAIMTPVRIDDFTKKVFDKLGKNTVYCTGFRPKNNDGYDYEADNTLTEGIKVLNGINKLLEEIGD